MCSSDGLYVTRIRDYFGIDNKKHLLFPMDFGYFFPRIEYIEGYFYGMVYMRQHLYITKSFHHLHIKPILDNTHSITEMQHSKFPSNDYTGITEYFLEHSGLTIKFKKCHIIKELEDLELFTEEFNIYPVIDFTNGFKIRVYPSQVNSTDSEILNLREYPFMFSSTVSKLLINESEYYEQVYL